MGKNSNRRKFKKLFFKIFPLDYSLYPLSKYFQIGEKNLDKMIKAKDAGRISGIFNLKKYSILEEKYGKIPKQGKPLSKMIKEIITDFFSGAPLWRSPNLQHNVGAAVNVASSIIYALSLDVNIYNINSELAGNALAAERAVAKILAELAEVDKEKAHGIFTFGGTATNLYAMKVAINKVFPHITFNGVPSNIKLIITEDAHFSHGVAANWLGIGTKNLMVIPANKDRRSNVKAAENIARKIIEEDNILAGMLINGGTTYDHAIDDIPSFVNLRNKLVKEYSLKYIPHIHVDSVIGWAWLMFKDYDFKSNPFNFNKDVLKKIKLQYQRISKIKLADSWGVDFHKGVGGCPIPCSIIMMNNKKDFLLLSKKHDPLTITHQLADEFSFDSPSDYTLETSRPGGAPLAALTALQTLGQEGYQLYLGRLIELVTLFRKLIQQLPDIIVANPYSLGYVTMVVIIPPELKNIFEHLNSNGKLLYLKNKANSETLTRLNNYMKAFFKWDQEVRMSQSFEAVYSYSSSYIKTSCGEKLSALKFYPVSPHLNEAHIKRTIKILKEQKAIFDKNIWLKNVLRQNKR
jgi:glutamate/tyrosine decarboxylase-like PLP-dependent enzyme